VTAKGQAEYVITIYLDQPVSAGVLAAELAQHITPLIARQKVCGDVVIGDVEGDWSLAPA
jgi:hypothetical protein